MSVSRGPKIVTSGLQLYLDAANTKSYVGSGTSWKDLSGNGKNGTIYGTTAFGTENCGNFLFTGTSGQYVGLGNVINFTTGDFTLGAWFKVSSFNGWRVIINKGTSGNSGYAMHINSSNFCASIQAESGTNQHSPSVAISTGILYYGVIVFDRDLEIRIYLNGQSATSGGYSAGNTNSISTGVGLNIGSYGGTDWNFLGNIYSIQIYNKALTQAEVTQNYRANKGRFGL